MSRRRIEAGIAAPGSFSLRTMTTGNGAAPKPMAPRTVCAPPTNPQQASLSFKFNSIGAKPAAPVSPNRGDDAGGGGNRLPSNFFSKPLPAGSKDSADAMRMTAVVDEMQARLRKTIEAKAVLEQQVQRLNGALQQERQTGASRVQALKTEVASVQESEMRLRSELAQRPAVKEVDTAKFATRVRSALEQEETNAKVADAEAKLAALCKREQSLGVEVKLLEGRKDAALAEQATVLSKEEVEDMLAQAAAAQTKIAALDDQRVIIEEDIQRYTGLRDSRRVEAEEAESTLSLANEATTKAVADEAAAKQQCLIKQQEVDGHESKIFQLRAHIEGMEITVSTAASMPACSITGAAAPTREVDPLDTPAAQVDTLSCCNDGIAYHFGHDAPIGVTRCMTTGAAVMTQDPGMNGMVQALVTDLQMYFNNAAAMHAKVGQEMVPGTATGAVAVC